MKTARARSSSQRSLYQWFKIALFAGATLFYAPAQPSPMKLTIAATKTTNRLKEF